ncbi:MAG: DMT family transporter [Clostridia bacterium]|nr:DMT family transporter [Clostridia bacterium]
MAKIKNYISPLLLLLAAMIWGFAFSAQDAASNVPPFTLGASRSLLASVFLIALIPIIDKSKKSEHRLFSKKGVDFNKFELIGGIISGAALAIASFFQQTGINEGTDAGKAAFITALYVVIVPIYALALKKRSPARVWISVIVAVIGFYFLCIDGEFNVAKADVLVLICAFIFPVQILAIDKYSQICDGVRMSAIQFITATVINTVLAFILENPIAFSEIGHSIGAIIFLGIGSSGIAYTLQIIGQKGVNPAVASVILSLESVFGVIGSAIFLKQTLEVRECVGAGIVFFAVLLAELDLKAIFKKKT